MGVGFREDGGVLAVKLAGLVAALVPTSVRGSATGHSQETQLAVTAICSLGRARPHHR